MFTLFCDSCGHSFDVEAHRLDNIKNSGYGGPYCEECGTKIEEQNILADMPHAIKRSVIVTDGYQSQWKG